MGFKGVKLRVDVIVEPGEDRREKVANNGEFGVLLTSFRYIRSTTRI